MKKDFWLYWESFIFLSTNYDSLFSYYSSRLNWLSVEYFIEMIKLNLMQSSRCTLENLNNAKNINSTENQTDLVEFIWGWNGNKKIKTITRHVERRWDSRSYYFKLNWRSTRNACRKYSSDSQCWRIRAEHRIIYSTFQTSRPSNLGLKFGSLKRWSSCKVRSLFVKWFKRIQWSISDFQVEVNSI